MQSVIGLIRRLLAKFGYELKRIAIPALDFDDYLKARAGDRRDLQPETLHVFDDEPRIQREIIGAFGLARAVFYSWDRVREPRLPREPAPHGKFWVALSAERNSLGEFFEQEPWTREADALLVRCSLGGLASGPVDFSEIHRRAEEAGLVLSDVSVSPQPVPLNASNSRVILIFSRRHPTAEDPVERNRRIQRLDAAWSFLTTPLARQSQFHWLTRRGSFGYAGGVFNPGGGLDGGTLLLLMRAEHLPWAVQEESEAEHMRSWRPVLLKIDESHQIAARTELGFQSPFAPDRIRIEDFRLFRFGDDLLCNHSVVTLPDDRPADNRPLRLELLDTRVGISRLAPGDGELRLIGFPQLDFPTGKTEKNWAMTAIADKLFLIYSIAPYRILQATAWPKLDFKTEIHRKISLPFAQSGLRVRNSIDPVDYDDRHLLHIVHQVYPSKQYVFWALLISKRTLLPVCVSDRPIARAGASLAASIIYISSAVARGNRISLFGGINDCSSGAWNIDRSALDFGWRALPGD
jgi:hypothetical protein